LFSGSVFSRGTSGFSVARLPWDCETTYRLPVAIWREMMDLHFPNSAWIRVQRDTFDALQRFKSTGAMTSWDEALESLLSVKGETA
jgi:predicted P-loop ATPase/GTPase